MKTKKYRKTATVEAFQWNGERPLPYPLINNWDNNPMTPKKITIPTLEGHMNVVEGSYICKGHHGEYWAVKKEIFESTYEQIN